MEFVTRIAKSATVKQFVHYNPKLAKTSKRSKIVKWNANQKKYTFLGHKLYDIFDSFL